MSKLGHSGSGDKPGPFQSFMDRFVKPILMGETKKEEQTTPPPMFGVYLHNNPHTPHLTVVRILREVFGMDQGAAHTLMMQVHRAGAEGKGLIGVYTKEIAEDKIKQAKEIEGRDIDDLRLGPEWPRALELSMAEEKQEGNT